MPTAEEEALDDLFEAGRIHSTAVVLFHSAVAAQAGLTASENKALEVVQRLGPLTPADLVRETGLAPASITGLLDRLERKGVARRVPHPHDRRRFLIKVDDGYQRQAAAVFDDFLTRLRRVCADYEPAQLRVIAGFLRSVAAEQTEAALRLAERSGGVEL